MSSLSSYASIKPTAKPPLPRHATYSHRMARPTLIHRFEIELVFDETYVSNRDAFEEEFNEYARCYNQWCKRLAHVYKRQPIQKRGHLRVRYERAELIDRDSVSLAGSAGSVHSDTDDTDSDDDDDTTTPQWDHRITLLFTSNAMVSQFMKMCDEFNDQVYKHFDTLFDICQFNMCLPEPYTCKADLDDA